MTHRLWIIALMCMTSAVGACRREPTESADRGTKEDDSASQIVPEVRPAASRPAAVHESIDQAHAETARKLIAGGVAYLLTRRDSDGGWSMGPNRQLQPAITAMATKALLQSPRFDANSPEVKKALDVLLSYRQDDGGIYDPKQGMASYTTSVAVMALVVADVEAHQPVIRDAVAFLKGQQIIPGSESPDGGMIDEAHPFVGGVSYGQHGRPDLSNVSMWMQALHDAGVSGDDPAMQRALRFVTRVQNRSESNPMVWAKEGTNDGGFVYAPAVVGDPAAGESKAGEGIGGAGLRSYGSMTYAGFKSLLYADVDRNDPRARAAFDWIRRYWRLDSNPNMPAARSLQGLYYYYHVFAKALRAWGEPVITDPKGGEHNWRHELIDALGQRVSDNGSWVNDADRWFEGDPALVTCYAVIALQEATRP
ncbi:MAG: prenyltransferase/squalene oxidase repeat-containing protein [Planctomycetota bacterium]|jgi:squalene-hopene/tetraprenyl-beta-curcumene cyclase